MHPYSYVFYLFYVILDLNIRYEMKKLFLPFIYYFSNQRFKNIKK